jgi:hypothetical protein
MAARKRTATKKRSKSARLGTIARIERELPPTLREYAKDVRNGLDGLEKQIEQATERTRKQIAVLLKDASYRLGQLEARGETAWRKLTATYRREAADVLDRIEKTLPARMTKKASKKKAAKKKTAKKKAAKKTGKKKASRKKK